MRLLVVANQTLGGRRIYERLQLYAMTDPPLSVFVLVPATRSDGFVASIVEEGSEAIHIDHAGLALAQSRLDAALSTISALDVAEVDGRVGVADPMQAIRQVMDQSFFPRILLATLPAGASRWLRMDLPHRIERQYDTFVEHIVGDVEVPGVSDHDVTSWEPVHVGAGNGDALEVLLVEDNIADVELTRIALERSAVDCNVDVARDGEEALEHLANNHADVVLLDLSMPKMGGHEMLEQMREHIDTDTTPVIVLTTSNRDSDREKAHELGAQAYVVKENDFVRFQEVLDGILTDATAITS